MTDTHEHVFEDRTPGVEDYEPTANYLSYTAGLVLAILLTIATFYGGTSLLITVSVILDLVQKINSHLVMRNYPGLTED